MKQKLSILNYGIKDYINVIDHPADLFEALRIGYNSCILKKTDNQEFCRYDRKRN